MRPTPHPLLARLCWLSVAVGSLLFGPAMLECLAKPAVFHPAVGSVTIQSATINADGDELTVALSGTATITNATGWTVEFDNLASRTLTYASGSGTSSLVFTPTAVSPSTDGRAPVGTVCTITYDADTGNVSGLADVTDQAVTNNSTVIPDPDLPQGVPTAALPANWNAAADHSPADNAALQELLDGDGSGDVAAGDVISLDADVDYGTIVIDANIQGAADNWIIIRSDEYTSLPTFSLTDSSGRVTSGDETYMATISRTPSQSGHASMNIDGGDGAVGAGYIRFIGIKFTQYGSYSSDVLAVVSTLTGGSGSSLGELPHHIGFDRCSFTHVNTMKGVQDCIRFDADDSFIVGCNFYSLYGAGNDGSNAIRWYLGNRKLIQNNSMECMGAACFIGNSTNLDLDVTDAVYKRNNHHHPTAWDDGSHGTTKSSFETKVCHRLLIEENVFENQAVASYNAGHAIISLKGEKNVTAQATIVGNQILGAQTGFVILAAASNSDASGDSGPNTDILVEDNLVITANRSVRLTIGDPLGGHSLKRLQIISNTFVNSSDYSVVCFGHNSGATAGNDFAYRDNVTTQGGIWPDGASEGSQCLNYSFDSDYSVTFNIFVGRSVSSYDNDATPAPLGTLTSNIFPANIAAVGFTDSGAGDYSIDAGSSYINSSSTGGVPGYDSTTYDPIWAEVAP